MEKIKILGVTLSVGSFEELTKRSTLQKGTYSCFCNSHMIYEHHTNKKFENVLDEADHVFADGMPLVYSLRILKGLRQERVAGNDVIMKLVEMSQIESLKMFWIGGSESVLNKISLDLKRKAIPHKTYSPPFLPIEEFDFDKQEELINSYHPDLVMVGLGCPKQEIWMHRMKGRVNAPMFGLGGAFLLYAGIDSRAPKWMRNLGLEWIYRLGLEPKRLFKRYLITNVYFCYLFGKELIRKKVFRK